MATSPTLEEPLVTPGKKRIWLPLVAVVAALVAGSIALWWVLSRADETRIDKVESNLAAVESGSYEDWSASFASHNVFAPPCWACATSDRDWFEFEQAINTRITIVEPCEEVAEIVSCTIQEENDLFAVAGISSPSVQEYTFNEDDVIVAIFLSDTDEEEYSEQNDPYFFYQTYVGWLAHSHPDVYSLAEGALPFSGELPFSAETAQLYLAYIDEFGPFWTGLHADADG